MKLHQMPDFLPNYALLLKQIEHDGFSLHKSGLVHQVFMHSTSTKKFEAVKQCIFNYLLLLPRNC